MTFKDHFSKHATEYSQARPSYPDQMFVYLASLVNTHDLAWDCATGNGQAAVSLAKYFKKVIATDASKSQIDNASAYDNIEYRVAKAERSGLPDHSIDMITVAQALHWFEFEKFYKEVKRVLKQDGIIAVWAYGLLHTNNDPINILINEFYTEIVGPYWPTERKYIDENYATIPFPFNEINPPKFTIELQWDCAQLLRYLSTWSACKRYERTNQHDPVSSWMKPRLLKCLTSLEDTFTATMPLMMRVGSLGYSK